MTLSFLWMSWLTFSGCRLFGAIEDARDLLDDPVTMQGLYVGLDLPAGFSAEGTVLDIGAQCLFRLLELTAAIGDDLVRHVFGLFTGDLPFLDEIIEDRLNFFLRRHGCANAREECLFDNI